MSQQPPSIRPRLQDIGPNPLQVALDDYDRMKSELEQCKYQLNELRIANGALSSEVSMLREHLERTDADRIRLQAVASTFMGGIRGLNAITMDLVQQAIKNGVEATEKAKPEETAELNEAGAEAQEIISRIPPKYSAGGVTMMPPNPFNR